MAYLFKVVDLPDDGFPTRPMSGSRGIATFKKSLPQKCGIASRLGKQGYTTTYNPNNVFSFESTRLSFETFTYLQDRRCTSRLLSTCNPRQVQSPQSRTSAEVLSTTPRCHMPLDTNVCNATQRNASTVAYITTVELLVTCFNPYGPST